MKKSKSSSAMIQEKFSQFVEKQTDCVVFLKDKTWLVLQGDKINQEKETPEIIGTNSITWEFEKILFSEVIEIQTREEALTRFIEQWKALKNNWRNHSVDTFIKACEYSHIVRSLAEIILETGKTSKEVYKIFLKRYGQQDSQYILDHIYKDVCKRKAFRFVVQGQITQS